MGFEQATLSETMQAVEALPGFNKTNHDERLRVQFSLQPHFNEAKSNIEGRPIYDEKVYVTIMVPGDRDIVCRPAWEKDYQRFPKQYQAFLNKSNQDTASGTPLKVVPWITASQVKELEFFNCFTLEQLAGLTDQNATKFMAINRLKQLAQDFVANAKAAAPFVALRTEIEDRDGRIAVLERQIKELMAASGAGAKEKVYVPDDKTSDNLGNQMKAFSVPAAE